jgi:hypothetical protein
MGILLGFAPFVAFAVAANFWGAMPGLMIGAAITGALLVKDLLRRQQPKILEIGTFLMFTGLVAWSSAPARFERKASGGHWTSPGHSRIHRHWEALHPPIRA